MEDCSTDEWLQQETLCHRQWTDKYVERPEMLMRQNDVWMSVGRRSLSHQNTLTFVHQVPHVVNRLPCFVAKRYILLQVWPAKNYSRKSWRSIVQLTLEGGNERKQTAVVTNLWLLGLRRLFPHVVASVRHTLELPFTNIFIPVNVLLNHLLETHRLTITTSLISSLHGCNILLEISHLL